MAPPVKLPGWPIAFSEIERYLPAAMAIVDLPTDSGFKAINASLDGNDFEADRFLLSPPTRFAQKYAKELNETEGLMSSSIATVSILISMTRPAA